MKNFFLFIVPSFIWGSTWLVITFQLGSVDPLVSVVYRFLAAALILILFLLIRRKSMKFDRKAHLLMAMQGFFLFGINYWLVYLAELYMTSGVVAILFATLVFMNIFNSSFFLKTPVRIHVLLASIVGIIGVSLIFRQEILVIDVSKQTMLAFIFSIAGAYSASLGNIISARNQKMKLPVLQTNAFGMLYGALFMAIITLIAGKHFTFDVSFKYVWSLLYLSVFGSIVAFGSYLTLLGKIGADRAAYVTLVVPVIALVLSTLFEGYQWSVVGLVGVVLILLGNVIVLRRKASVH